MRNSIILSKYNMAAGLPYNGWNELVRHGRDKHYYHARKCGILKPATECLGCREPFDPDCVPYHAEEYGSTLEAYWTSCEPLCHRCHAMLHARFQTPHRWHLYITQAVNNCIDITEFPQGKTIAALLSKFKNRKDIAYQAMPDNAPDYFKSLPMEEYAGAEKTATLLVIDLNTDYKVEVPDWTLYGLTLDKLAKAGRESLIDRGVDIEGFLSNKIKLPRNAEGDPVYKRLYV